MNHQPIGSDDIIIEDSVHSTIERNVFDFHRRRQQLNDVGIPNKKGLLFFGPPGTGKTFTCKYIYSQLPDVTCLIASGKSLAQIKPLCNVARMLQPSLVVLEDVDLVFASREINLYSSVLGDMLDELDGFQTDDAVTFLLTTNSIERLEAAIKDRPGRISQCLYFGPPSQPLRERYLRRYVQDYDSSQLDMEELVLLTDGTTHAYLKELVFRAVQVALENTDPGDSVEPDGLRLENEHFVIAHREMTEGRNDLAASIIGFGSNQDY